MLTWTVLVVDGRASLVAQVKLLGQMEKPMTTVLWGTTVAAIVVYMRHFLSPLHTIQSDES